MTESTPEFPPVPAPVASPRIGSAERQQAMDALDAHMDAGRLDPEEYGERVAQASAARTVQDLVPLFADLPEPHPAAVRPSAASNWTASTGPASNWPASNGPASNGPVPNAPAPAAPAPAAPGPAYAAAEVSRRSGDKVAPLGGRSGEVAVAAMPFLAVALFFLVPGPSWLFFLLIPAAGAIVYGGRGSGGRNRNRDRNRKRDR